MNTLSNYKRIRSLGEGGFGTVFLAEEIATGRKFAIKQLRADRNAEEFAELFRKEVGYLYDFDHPNIVKLIFGDLRERCLVMEYMAGGNLRNEMRRYPHGQMPAKRALVLIGQALDALDYIHARSLVHRDVKPGNLLLDEAASIVKLSDFGAAWDTSLASRPEWRTIGDANYESPEQIEQKRELDCRSDLYSLGFVLFEMLAGERPFGPGKARLTQPLPDLRQIRPDLPKAVVAVVERSLAVHPDERFQSAREMRAAVDDALRVASDVQPIVSKLRRPRVAALDRIPRWFVAMPLLGLGLAAGIFIAALRPDAASIAQDSLASHAVPSEIERVLEIPMTPVTVFAASTAMRTLERPAKTDPATRAAPADAAPTPTQRPLPTFTPTASPVPPTPTVTPIPPTATPPPTVVPPPTRRPTLQPTEPPTAIPLPTNPPPPPPVANITAGRGACPFAPGKKEWVASANGRFCALWNGQSGSEVFIRSSGSLPNYGFACLDKGDGSGLQPDLPANFDYNIGPTSGTRVIRVRVAPPGSGLSCNALTGYYDDSIVLQLDWGLYF